MDSPTPPPVSHQRTDADAAAGPDSAPRRTWLVAGRTYLAWLRTGLGAIGYGALGIFLLCVSADRAQQVRAAIAAQRALPRDAWTIWVLTAACLVLAAFTGVLIAVA